MKRRSWRGLAPRRARRPPRALDYLERIVNPDRLVKLTAATMSRLQAGLRKPRDTTRPAMKDTTIARHFAMSRAALSWAVSMGMLPKVPEMHPPKLAKGQALMRGRPITAEEFDRMLDKVGAALVDACKAKRGERAKTQTNPRVKRKQPTMPPTVRPERVESWQRFLTGLWLSGLRLSEGLALSWDEGAPFSVDLAGKRPVFRIYCQAQKARRDETVPMTPDFAQFLAQIPEAERHGPVFKLACQRGGKPIGPGKVGR